MKKKIYFILFILISTIYIVPLTGCEQWLNPNARLANNGNGIAKNTGTAPAEIPAVKSEPSNSPSADDSEPSVDDSEPSADNNDDSEPSADNNDISEPSSEASDDAEDTEHSPFEGDYKLTGVIYIMGGNTINAANFLGKLGTDWYGYATVTADGHIDGEFTMPPMAKQIDGPFSFDIIEVTEESARISSPECETDSDWVEYSLDGEELHITVDMKNFCKAETGPTEEAVFHFAPDVAANTDTTDTGITDTDTADTDTADTDADETATGSDEIVLEDESDMAADTTPQIEDAAAPPPQTANKKEEYTAAADAIENCQNNMDANAKPEMLQEHMRECMAKAGFDWDAIAEEDLSQENAGGDSTVSPVTTSSTGSSSARSTEPMQIVAPVQVDSKCMIDTLIKSH